MQELQRQQGTKSNLFRPAADEECKLWKQVEIQQTPTKRKQL
jgi:hypothetical protein